MTSRDSKNNVELQEVRVELGDTSQPEEEEEPFLGKDKNVIDANSPAKEAAKKRNAFFAVCFYWVTSLSLVFLNKLVMDGDVTNLDAPLFMSWTQFVMTAICCYILGILGRSIKMFAFFPPFEYKLAIARKVMPLTIVFLGMIVFNNLCLKYVEVSFYQVARSLTIVFNVIFTYFVLNKQTNRLTLLCCVVIIVGYLLGCDGEVRFSWIGVIFGVLSSVFVALNSIYVKKILELVDNNSEKLMIYNNVNASILLPVIILFFTDETTVIMENQESFYTSIFWLITVVAGVFGFLINFASYIQIKFTSPLSHNVSGTAKAAVQTVIALIVFKNPIKLKGIVGIIIVILGSFAYSRVK